MISLRDFKFVFIVVAVQIAASTHLAFAHSIDRSSCSAFKKGFRKLKPGDQFAGNIYFEGTSEARAKHAEEMSAAGRDPVIKLLARHKDIIPPNTSVLEIGPFLKPVTGDLANNRRWIVWEYDQQAAQSIADTGRADVYNVDLNKLDRNQWDHFIGVQKSDANTKSANYGAVILSSVLNYIDRHVVIDRVMQNMADGGLVIIGNSNIGDRGKMLEEIPPNGSQILEQLLLGYGDRIEILAGSSIFLGGFTGSRTGIQIAFRVFKKKRIARDLYELGQDFLAYFEAAPLVLKFSSNPDPESFKFWVSEDPSDIAKAKDDIRTNRLHVTPWLERNRRAEIDLLYEKNQARLERVIAAKFGSPEALELKKELINPRREYFLPEREVFAASLDLRENLRVEYIKEHASEIYKRLHHVR